MTGFYVLFHVATEGNQIGELERRLRVTEQVIKFITVRTDEEEKRLAKVKALRDSKVKRSTLPPTPPPAPAQAAPTSVEEAPAQDSAAIAEEASENAAEAGIETAASTEEVPAAV